jgi:hypothetical protein
MDKTLLLLHLHAPKKVQSGEAIAEFDEFPSAAAVFLPTSEGVSETLEGASVWEIKACLGRIDLGIFCNDVAPYSKYRIRVIGEVAPDIREFFVGTPDGDWLVQYSAETEIQRTVGYLNQLYMIWVCSEGKMCLKTFVQRNENNGGIFTLAIPFLPKTPSR